MTAELHYRRRRGTLLIKEERFCLRGIPYAFMTVWKRIVLTCERIVVVIFFCGRYDYRVNSVIRDGTIASFE